MKTFFRYAISLLLLAAGLLLLNCAAFRSWASWGPPTNFPEAWAEGARVCLGYGLALVILSTSSFIALGRLNAGKRVKLLSLPTALIIIAALVAVMPHLYRLLTIDKCLDNGGSWNYKIYRCEH